MQLNRSFTIRLIITITAITLTAVLSTLLYQHKEQTPSTSMGVIDAYVINLTPQVSGVIKTIYIHDNQYVKKGTDIAQVDPTPYQLKLEQAKAAVHSAEIAWKSTQYRLKKPTKAATYSSKQAHENNLYEREMASSILNKSKASLALAKQQLADTHIVASSSGHITNLHVTQGSYAHKETPLFTLVSNHYWAYGFFKETELPNIHIGDHAKITLMGYNNKTLRGTVESIGYGIKRTDIQMTNGHLPTADPVQNWVRLAQRIPVKIKLAYIPPNLHLFVGQSAYITLHTASDSK